MNETWYVMEDGSAGDPREIATGADGKLRHSDGRAVAYAPHGPRSRSVDADEEREKVAAASEKAAKAAAAAKAAKPASVAKGAEGGAATRDMKPEDVKPGEEAGGYKTRESKAN